MSNRSTKEKWIKTFQFLAAYLVAAWTFLQFFDWLLNRYNLSPNWVDLLLWTFIGIIPSLILYLFHRERIHKGIIKLREKIFIPINIILLVVILYFVFGNSDLGATTKKVTFETSLGHLETKTFTKEEFRVGFPIYNFEQLQEKDSLFNWLQFSMGRILFEDLLQNKNLSPEYNYRTSTTDKIRDASLFYKKYVDGTFEIVDSVFYFNTYIRKASNAKVLAKKEFKGDDLFKLIDDISVFIATEMDKKGNISYIDLPVNEHITNSIEALKAYAFRDYAKAISIDKRFALAYLQEAKEIMKQNRGQLEAQDIIDKAFIMKSKLPLQKQLEVLIQKNLAYGNFKEAEKQVKLQLEVDPNNRFYNEVLFSIYGETKNTQAYFEATQKLFEKNRSSYNGNNLFDAALVVGFEDQLLQALGSFEIIDPYIKYLKLEPLLHNNNFEEAKRIFNEYKLSYTGNRNRLQAYDSIFKNLEDTSVKDIDLSEFKGVYRSNINEQTLEFWLENGRLVEYVKNQAMKAYLPTGQDAIANGFIEDYTAYVSLEKDPSDKVFGILKTIFYWNRTAEVFFWKMDDNLIKAENAFKAKEFQKAKKLYTLSKVDNPRHFFIDNVMACIDFKLNNDTLILNSNLKKHSGTYGPRKFWVEDGKFYYKRVEENINLAKVELLPVNDTLYMDMTRLGTLMSFVDENDKQVSRSYSLDVKDGTWKVNNEEVNVFEKDED